MSNKIEQVEKHWTTELLNIFGMWLWKKEEFGHALLCITGPIWGYKIGHQLQITWYNLFTNEDYDEFVPTLFVSDFDLGIRPFAHSGGVTDEFILFVWKNMEINFIEDSIFMNYKTGKPLSTSTLNRELQRFAKEFLNEYEEKLEEKIHLKPLKSNAFQIAWALKMLETYHYSKKCFIDISKFMGHRTLKDTIKLLEVEPFDKIVYDFNGVFREGKLTTELLEDNDKIRKYFREAEFDAWNQFHSSILS